MKEKILAALRSKYANMGLSDKALLGIATMLAITTTEEANIDTAVSSEGVVEALKGIQAEGDIRAAKAKAEKDKKEPEKKDDPEKKEPVIETATEKMLRELLESNKKLNERFELLEGGNVLKNRKQLLEDKLKDAPEIIKTQMIEDFDLMSFKDDEAFTGYLTKVETRVAGAKQQESNTELSNMPGPVMGKPNADGVSSGTAAYIATKTAEKAATTGLEGKKI